MTPTETQMMLTNLLSMYPNHTINDFATEQWCQSMSNVPADAAYATMKAWIDTEKWFPTVAEFKQRATSLSSGLPGPDTAWQMVMDRIRSTYPGHPAESWDAPGIVQAAAKDVGGTWAIRNSERPEDIRKRFVAAYEDRRKATMDGRVMLSSMKELT